MSGIFGESYRKKVQDVNEGAIPDQRSGLESNINLSGRKITYSDPQFTDPRDDLVKGLLRVGKGVVDRAIEEAHTEEFNQGFVDGTNEGLADAEANEGGLRSLLGIKSSYLKGFQERVVGDAINENLALGTQNMEMDVAKFSTSDYARAKKKELIDIASQYDDPEVKKQVLKGLTQNIRTLARSHTVKRIAHEKELRERAVIDSVHTASRALITAAETGDTGAMLETSSRLMDTFKRPEGMTEDDYSDVITEATIGQLRNGNQAVVDFLKTSGKFDELVTEDQEAIQHELDIFSSKQSKMFFVAQTEIMEAIQNQSPDLEKKIEAVNRKYPGLLDANKLRQMDLERKQELYEEAREDAEHDSWLASGDSRAQSLPEKDRNESFNRLIKDMAIDGMRAEKQSRLTQASMNGEQVDFDPIALRDGTDTYSQAEINDYVQRNPQQFITMWKKNQLPMGALSQSIGNTSAMLSSPKLSQENLNAIKKNMEFLNKFREADPTLFAKHARSDSELTDYEMYDEYVNKQLMPPRNAIELMRQIKSRPELTKFNTNQLDAIDENVEDITDDIVGEIGEKFLWFFDKNPTNMGAMEGAVRDAYEKSLKLSRGDEVAARAATRSIFMKRSKVIGNKFVPNGALLDKHANGFDLEAYIRGANADEYFQDFVLRGKRFPPDIDLLDDERVSILPIDGGRRIQFSMLHPDTEETITLHMDLPQTKEHMRPYGIKSVGHTIINTVDQFTGMQTRFGGKIAETIKETIE